MGNNSQLWEMNDYCEIDLESGKRIKVSPTKMNPRFD